MKITLHYKLFGAILLAILVVVIYMSLVMQWSFDRGFLNYVNVVEQEQLGKIATDLEAHYKDKKSWVEFSTHPEQMAIIIVKSYPEGKLKERFLERIREEKLPSKMVPSGPGSKPGAWRSARTSEGSSHRVTPSPLPPRFGLITSG